MSSAIADTEDDTILSERYGSYGRDLLTNGSYELTLHFAETYHNETASASLMSVSKASRWLPISIFMPA